MGGIVCSKKSSVTQTHPDTITPGLVDRTRTNSSHYFDVATASDLAFAIATMQSHDSCYFYVHTYLIKHVPIRRGSIQLTGATTR